MKIYVLCENAFQTPLYNIAMYTNKKDALDAAITASGYKQNHIVIISFEKELGIAQMQYCGIEAVCYKGRIVR